MFIVEVLTQYSRLDRPFTYFYNGKTLEIGVRVLINFNNRKIVGYVTKVTATTETISVASERLGIILTEISDVLDTKPLLTTELMELSDFVTSYYLTTKISVLNAMLPPSLKPSTSALRGPQIKVQTIATFNPSFTNFEQVRAYDLSLLNEIITRGNVTLRSTNKNKLNRLYVLNAITYRDVEKYRLQYEHYPPEEHKTLTPKQQEAMLSLIHI